MKSCDSRHHVKNETEQKLDSYLLLLLCTLLKCCLQKRAEICLRAPYSIGHSGKTDSQTNLLLNQVSLIMYGNFFHSNMEIFFKNPGKFTRFKNLQKRAAYCLK